MLKLTKTGVGLLTRQYRSVLKKCWAINVGLFAIMFSNIQHADASIELSLSNMGSVYLVNYSDVGIHNFLTTSDLSDYVKSGSLSSTLSSYATQAYVDEAVASAGGGSSVTLDTTFDAESTNGATSQAIANYLNNNYYRKNEKSGILNGVKEGEIGNEIGDNFSKFRAVNGDFASKNGSFVLKNDNFASNNPSRLGAFAKCEKACSRPSERKGVTANSAFEFNRQNVASTDAGTTLNNRRQFKVVMDNLSQCHADNGDFSLKNPSRLGAFAKCEKACPRPSERFPASMEKNSAFEQYSRSARGTFLFVSQTHKNVLDNFSKLAANDNFATTTFLRAI